MSANKTLLEGLGMPLAFCEAQISLYIGRCRAGAAFQETAVAHMANPSEGLRSCLFFPLWQLPLGSGLHLALIKETPQDDLRSTPPFL